MTNTPNNAKMLALSALLTSSMAAAQPVVQPQPPEPRWSVTLTQRTDPLGSGAGGQSVTLTSDGRSTLGFWQNGFAGPQPLYSVERLEHPERLEAVEQALKSLESIGSQEIKAKLDETVLTYRRGGRTQTFAAEKGPLTGAPGVVQQAVEKAVESDQPEPGMTSPTWSVIWEERATGAALEAGWEKREFTVDSNGAAHWTYYKPAWITAGRWQIHLPEIGQQERAALQESFGQFTLSPNLDEAAESPFSVTLDTGEGFAQARSSDGSYQGPFQALHLKLVGASSGSDALQDEPWLYHQ